jgi:hypothetical protein
MLALPSCPPLRRVIGIIHDGKRWQEAVQIEAQMHLGGSPAPAVLRPVHAVGHTNCMVVEYTAWILTFKRRSGPLH